jgi:septum formation protein
VELLRELGVPFQVVPSQASELHDQHIPVITLCELNAERKAAWVGERYPDRLVLGADTLVALGQQIFGKPRSLAEAEEMLLQLQGQTHQVVTGVCLLQLQTGFRDRFHDLTQVTFKPLNREQVREYISKVHVLDKAGAYAIQEHGDLIIAGTAGSYSNVVGLPQELLRNRLSQVSGWNRR